MVKQKIISRAGIVFAIILAVSFLGYIPVMGGMGMPDPPPEPVEPVITPGPLGAPVRVDSYTADTLIVSDYSSGTVFAVQKNDPTLVEPLFTIEGRALAIGHSGKNIIVGNGSTGNIEIYNRKGKLIRILNEDAYIQRPSDVAVDQKTGQIFVVDSREHQVKVYDKKKFLYGFGTAQMVNPVGIALDRENMLVYISDHGDTMQGIPAAIFIYSYEGGYVEYLDSSEFGFYRPRGIAYDQGRLYVTDTLAGTITVIDTLTKSKLGELGEYGSDPGQLLQPQDVVIDQDGAYVYVANKRLGRIEKIANEGLGQ